MMFSSKASPPKRQAAVAQLIADLNLDRNPILIGPWRSEVGFECLYWLPFLQWLAPRVHDFEKRAAVVTRGGLAPLYQHIATQGYDLYALRSVSDVRQENLYDLQIRQKGKTIKQLQPTSWDDAVLADAAKALGLGAVCHTLHPAWMYWALSPFWDEHVGMAYLASMTDYRLLPKVALPDAPALPEKFVAVKCYARATFPYPHPDVAGWIQRTVATVAAQCPVVVLSSARGPEDVSYDDHADVPLSGPNITMLPPVAPEQNLLVQAAILAKATAFIGTYGGVAQLALRMGVPSLSVWHEWNSTAAAHHHLSWWLSKVTKVPFVSGSIADSDLWRQVIPATVVEKQAVAA